MADPEAPWRRRFRAAAVSLPSWARDRPDRLLYSSNASGTWELYAWDRERDTHRQVTDRPEGTMAGGLDPTGEWIWWFDDEKGNENGRWVVEPFEPAPGTTARPAASSLPPAYGAGLGEERVDAIDLDVRVRHAAGRPLSRRAQQHPVRSPDL